MTTSTFTTQDAVSVDGRVIPVEYLAGVAHITDLFNRLRDQMTLPEGSPRTIKRSHVSNWANRRDTTGFPEPLPIPALQGIYVWDIRDFVRHEDGDANGSDVTERLIWTGPPGRWARPRPVE